MQMISSPKTFFLYLFLKAQAIALLAIGQRTGALTRFERMLLLFPLDRYALASRAYVLFQFNRVSEAIVNLQQLTALTDPQTQRATAWFNLGYALQHAGRHQEAQVAFEQAIECNFCMDNAWYGLGLVLMHQQHFLEARQALRKVTALQPMSPHGWYRLAEVCVMLGELQEARKVVEHLRRFEPKVAAQLEREIGLIDAVQFQSAKPNGSARRTHTLAS
jgi:tetratricopeptide (TPR) repeat protein